MDLQRFGDWYATCGITNLPIKAGDKAYCVVLKQQIKDLTADCLLNPQSVFKLVTLPLKGVMNCYGSFSTIDNSTVIEKHLQILFNNYDSLFQNYENLIDCKFKGYALEYFHESAYVSLVNHQIINYVLSKSYSAFQFDNLRKTVLEQIKYSSLNFYENFIDFSDEVTDVLRDLVFLLLLNKSFNESRRFFSPQLGIQKENIELTKFIANLTLNFNRE